MAAAVIGNKAEQYAISGAFLLVYLSNKLIIMGRCDQHDNFQFNASPGVEAGPNRASRARHGSRGQMVGGQREGAIGGRISRAVDE